MELKLGQIVFLVSGGPPMTMRAIAGDQATCSWEHAGNIALDRFPVASLTRYDPAVDDAADDSPQKEQSMELHIGDAVWLKSGGHAMTVRDFEGGRVGCQWSADGKLEFTTFPAAMLTRDRPPSQIGETFREYEEWDRLTEKVDPTAAGN